MADTYISGSLLQWVWDHYIAYIVTVVQLAQLSLQDI